MKKQPQNKKYTTTIPHTPVRFLLYITRSQRRWMLLAFFTVFLAATLDQFSYYFIKLIIDSANAGNLDRALFLGLVFPVWVFVDQLLWRSSGFFGMKWVTTSKKEMYNTIVPYAMNHSHSYFSDRFAGSILSKINNISGAMEQLIIDVLWTHFNTFLSLIVTLILIATVDMVSAFLFIGLIFVLVAINSMLAPEKKRRSKDAAESTTALRGYIVDMYGNVGAVRQYARKPLEAKLLEEKAERDRYTHQRTWIYTEFMLVINSGVLFLFGFGIFYSLITRWSSGAITLGDFVLVLSLVASLSGTLVFIGRAFNNTARSLGESQEGLDDLLLEHDVIDKNSATSLVTKGGSVKLSNVQFTYDQNQVFKDFDLTIEPGQRLGLVGPSGAGKTTFVSLLLRQHDIQSGAITIDGQNIAEVTQDSLREAIAVVPQEPLLFHRSIRENIAYGKPDATDEEIIAVAKKAQAHDFIMSLPEQYETMVGERGVKLSGGQKQRIAIARAMLKDAPILVLDEATSALDSESEVEIQKALHVLMEGKTVVAIAHRLSTLREMDRIIVLENGQIVEDGTHDTLSKAGGTYERLWNHQAGGFLQE